MMESTAGEEEYRLDDRDATLNADIAEVKSLSFVKALELQSQERKQSESVTNLAQKRKARHESLVNGWYEEKKTYFDDVEEEVYREGVAMKAELEGVDASISSQLQRLEDDSYVVTRNYGHIIDIWAALEGLLSQRRAVIDKFLGSLENIERRRATDMKHTLRGLVRNLIEAGHELEPTIQRFVEGEAHDVNKVVLCNRREAAVLGAHMRKGHVYRHAQVRMEWEKGLQHWRHVRHNDALGNMTATLNSNDYVTPPQRKHILEDINDFRQSLHDNRRMPLLHQLAQLPPDSLASDTVEGIRNQLEDIAGEEQSGIAQRFASLREAQAAVISSAEDAIEDLRKRLHHFAALEKEGDLARLGEILEALVKHGGLQAAPPNEDGEDDDDNNPMAEFWRKAGNLKKTLESVYLALQSPNLIYEDNLASVEVQVAQVLSCFGLNEILEKQGKMADKTSLLETLNAIRRGSKRELIRLVPVLTRQIASFRGVSDVNPGIVEELTTAHGQLESIVEELLSAGLIGESTVAGSTVAGSTIGSRTQGTRTARGSGTVRTGKQSSVAGGAGGGTAASRGNSRKRSTSGSSVSGRSRSQSRAGSVSGRSSGGLTDATDLTNSTAALRLNELRDIQRRIAMVLSISDLPSTFQPALEDIRQGIEQQRVANHAIDGVIAKDITPLLNKRREEGDNVLNHCGIYLQDETAHLADACDHICTYYKQVAKRMEMFYEKEHNIDEEVEDDLNGALDDYEAEDEQREFGVKDLLLHLRHAPTEEALNVAMDNVLAGLDAIESNYRTYHRKAVGIANQHPLLLDTNVRRVRSALASAFRLTIIDPAAVDGECTEEEKEELEALDTARFQVELATARTQAEEEWKKKKEEEAAAAAAKKKKKKSPRQKEAEAEEQPDIDEEELKAQVEAKIAEEKEKERQHMLSLPRFISSIGTEYAVREGPEAIGKTLLLPDKEDEDEETNTAGPGTAGEAKEGDQQTAEEASGGNEENEDGEGNEEDKKEGSAPPAKPKNPFLSDDGLPLEVDGSPSAIVVHIEEHTLAKFLENLRNSILEAFDVHVSEKRKNVEALRHLRNRERTEELEERLRRHWPRKGKAEVEVRQPRDSELLAHAKKLERHVQKVETRREAVQQGFDELLETAQAALREYRQRLRALTRSLPKQTSLAALQGVQQRIKAAIADFTAEQAEFEAKLTAFSTDEVDKLKLLNTDFLRTCVLFSEGGNYAEEERETSRQRLEGLEQGIDAAAANREELKHAFIENCSKTKELIDDFNTKYASNVKDLSMREGLGKRFGGPRRSAQEKIRSEYAWSDAAQQSINDHLQRLKALIAEETNVQRQTPQCVEIRTCIGQLRDELAQRGHFLQAFRKDVRPFSSATVSVSFEPEQAKEAEEPTAPAAAAKGKGKAPAKASPRGGKGAKDASSSPRAEQPQRTLINEVRSAIEQCKVDTRVLFEEEGRPLGPDELPDSLVKYLTKQENTVVEKREKDARTFRDQINRLHELLLEAPASAMRNVGEYLRSEAEAAEKTAQKNFSAQAAVLKAVKVKHNKELAPHLADPNKLEELRDLQQRELSRIEDTKKEILQLRSRVRSDRATQGPRAAALLAFHAQQLVKVCGECPAAEDLFPLPGDEAIVPKKKSLKRLRKVQRRAAVGKEGLEGVGDETKEEGTGEAGEGDDETAKLEALLVPYFENGLPFPERDWHGLAIERGNLPEPPQWVAALEGEGKKEAEEEAASKAPAKGKGSPRGGKGGKGPRGKAAAAAEPPAEAAPQAVGAFRGAYTSFARRIIRARDDTYERLCNCIQTAVKDVETQAKVLWDAENEWEATWNREIERYEELSNIGQ